MSGNLPSIHLVPPNKGGSTLRHLGICGDRSGSPGSTTAPTDESPISPGFSSPIPSPRSRRPSVDLRDLESNTAGDVSSNVGSTDFEDQTLHDALQESLDSMAGACSRLRGEDMLSVIEDGEMTVLAFAPPQRFDQEIVNSFQRSEKLAAEILRMSPEEAMGSRSELSGNRLQEAEQLLIEKDMELNSLRRALDDARSATATAQAKLCRAQATLKVRDEMIKAKNQEISDMHIELHTAAREAAALQLRCRRVEDRPNDDGRSTVELDFLRRQCKLLEEMNLQLRRDQWQAAASGSSGNVEPMEEIPSEPIVPTKGREKEQEVNNGPLPSISRAAAKAVA